MPIYVDESGSLPAGAMIMAGVEIEADAALQLLDRFKAITGLRGELKGSRIAIIERAFFFELFQRFGGRAQVCIVHDDPQRIGPRPDDIDVYVALLTQLVNEWTPIAGDCANVIIDAGRYDVLALEAVRLNIQKLLASCGSAQMIESHRSAGVQIADVIANSFFNIAIRSARSDKISTIVAPFIAADFIRTSNLRERPKPKTKYPALQSNAGHSLKS